jgi:hypothetical protein
LAFSQLHVEREAQVGVSGGVSAANAPALKRGLEDHHRDVRRVDSNLSEPLDEGPVEVPLGVGGAAGNAVISISVYRSELPNGISTSD